MSLHLFGFQCLHYSLNLHLDVKCLELISYCLPLAVMSYCHRKQCMSLKCKQETGVMTYNQMPPQMLLTSIKNELKTTLERMRKVLSKLILLGKEMVQFHQDTTTTTTHTGKSQTQSKSLDAMVMSGTH